MKNKLVKFIDFLAQSELTIILWIITIVVVLCVIFSANAHAKDSPFYQRNREGDCVEDAQELMRDDIRALSRFERELLALCIKLEDTTSPLCYKPFLWYDHTLEAHIKECALKLEV